MSYVVSIRETFRGGPDARTEQTNMCGIMTFTRMDQLIEYVENDISEIYSKYYVLRKTVITEQTRLACKILFERPGKHGRLLRRYEITKDRKQYFDDEFSLI